jgi:hypothetical protein
MSVYTKFGSGIWQWEPFRRLERGHDDITGRCTKLFWIALYTAPESKLVVPGMFLGSITAMADATGIQVDDARRYLDRLLEDDMVEYDVERRVLRLTALPDCGESPPNGNALRGWWRKFQTVPACPVRDAHIIVLRWILEEWSRVNAKPISQDHARAWDETFGRLPIPAPRPRARKHIQTTLFAPSQASGNGFADGTDVRSVDNSSLIRDPKENKNLETNGEWFRNQRDQDQDHDQDLSGSGSGGGEGSAVGRVLTLVPGGLDADDLAEALAKATAGKFPRALTREQRAALQRAIGACGDLARAVDVLNVLGDYVKRGMPGFHPHPDRMTPEERMEISKGISPERVSAPGWLPAAIQKANAWAASVAEKQAMLASVSGNLGV